ncbi:unnamed protein product [Schistosoma curassoni]|uniref:Ovule protein n=1 Tax=Schistosoma curassoni TaxID=6186 RepID=A0A183JMV0_9TREM|nr:unnamed protein product [Schistosoma curassoni]
MGMSGALTGLVGMEDLLRGVGKPSFQTSDAHKLQDPKETNGKSFNIKDSVSCSSSIIPDEVSSRFIPIGSFLSSILEPIPQGQELAVGSMTTSTDESKFTVQNYHSSSNHHTTTKLKNEVCCPCRLINSRVTQQRNYPRDTGQTCNSTTPLTTNITEAIAKQTIVSFSYQNPYYFNEFSVRCMSVFTHL